MTIREAREIIRRVLVAILENRIKRLSPELRDDIAEEITQALIREAGPALERLVRGFSATGLVPKCRHEPTGFDYICIMCHEVVKAMR